MDVVKRAIAICFGVLLFLVPLILWPFTSEVFEFNKIVITYSLTAVIVGLWVIRMIVERKIIFRRTMLDLPLILFLLSQIFSTIFSIDVRTSIFGYYSRFNGGLLSVISYTLLYWAFVANVGKSSAKKILKVSLILASLVSIYGILEHFGIDKNVWVQDVQNRIFSTLGQPNWLAAYLVAFLPIVFAMFTKSKLKTLNYLVAILFFVTVLFTKSRSGLLGFVAADIVFWSFVLFKNFKKQIKPFLIFNISFLILFLTIGSSLATRLQAPSPTPSSPALEIGGTDSGKIRQIVWRGAIDVWRHNPLIGTGVETFGYSYYLYRPVEHNLVSEWDYIYNKAHNEFLNIAANTGTFGIATYLLLIGSSIILFLKTMRQKEGQTVPAFLAGYVGLIVSNFFGFSVVPTQLQLFLFPAFAVVLKTNKKKGKEENISFKNLAIFQIVASFLAAVTVIVVIGLIIRYWYVDTLYAKAKAYDAANIPNLGSIYAQKAVNLAPKEPFYHMTLASLRSKMDDAQTATREAETAVKLSPINISLRKIEFGILIRLSTTNNEYLTQASNVLEETIAHAPTDAKLYYNLSLTYARLGEVDKSLATLQKTIELKPNYKEARYAYAVILADQGKKDKAREQLNYILEHIDPKDENTKQQLESL